MPDVVYNTLLELYLSDMGSCSQEEERASKELKAMDLLKKPEVCYVSVPTWFGGLPLCYNILVLILLR